MMGSTSTPYLRSTRQQGAACAGRMTTQDAEMALRSSTVLVPPHATRRTFTYATLWGTYEPVYLLRLLLSIQIFNGQEHEESAMENKKSILQ
jgi:hypothetical protein